MQLRIAVDVVDVIFTVGFPRETGEITIKLGGSLEHGIAVLQRIENRSLRDGPFDLDWHFMPYVRQRAEVLR